MALLNTTSSSSPASSAATDALIVCDNLVKIYKVAGLEVFALQGLDLVVRRGELLGIVGASGSGKSTLMNILGGLDRPSAGRVWVNGQDLLNLSDTALDRYRRALVGFVWQQGARNLIPYLNARENVELPMTLAGLSGRKKRARASELLEAVGLSERSKHRLVELSGGEQQRVAIAVALANDPRLLLADEPTGELDSNTALAIYQTLRGLNQRYQLTLVIVSHDPTIAQHVDRVVAVRDGKLASETVRSTRPANGSRANGGGAPVGKGITVGTPTEVGKPTGVGSPAEVGGPAETEETTIIEELTVLDSAGRLQIPKEYLRRLKIQSRVRLEVTGEGILITPAESGHVVSAEVLGAALDAGRRAGRQRGGLVGRVLNGVRERVMSADAPASRPLAEAGQDKDSPAGQKPQWMKNLFRAQAKAPVTMDEAAAPAPPRGGPAARQQNLETDHFGAGTGARGVHHHGTHEGSPAEKGPDTSPENSGFVSPSGTDPAEVRHD